MANNNNNRPDIDFEQDLWKAADELRGAVAENQYKDFGLSLIFIKHLRERYVIRRYEIQDLKDNQLMNTPDHLDRIHRFPPGQRSRRVFGKDGI